MLYKLLTQNLTTHDGFQWEVDKTYTIDKPGNTLCSDEVFHAYHSPETAALFNPIHGEIQNPLCYLVDTSEIVADDGLKVGVKSMRLVEQIKLSVFTHRQRTIFAILCAKRVKKHRYTPIPKWDKWANDYINNCATSIDYTTAAADADAAAYDACAADSYATYATYAAYAAAHAACTACAANASNAAKAAAYAADYAAAAYAARADAGINFTSLAKEALTYKT